MAAMTPKQRVKTAVAHQEPDRVPIQIYLTPEIEQRLNEHFKGAPLAEVLCVDFREVGPVSRDASLKPDPRKSLTIRGETQNQPATTEFAPGSGLPIAWRDEFGVGYSMIANPSGGEYAEATDLTLSRLYTMDDVANYKWPNPDMYDYSVIPDQIEAVRDYAVFVGGAGTPDIINGVSRGRGMEQVLIDIATEDEVGIAIIDKRVDYLYEKIKRCLEAGNGKIDIVCLGEDLGNQNGPMMSPATFDRFFRPRLEKFYKLAHDYGALAMMHSCGSTRALQPRLIEMGLDILDAVQPEPAGMEPEGIKRDFGDKLTYCGMISTQETLPHGTVEQCRAEARHRLDVIAKGGGYIFAPAHCIQPDTPLENVLAIYEEATGKKFI